MVKIIKYRPRVRAAKRAPKRVGRRRLVGRQTTLHEFALGQPVRNIIRGGANLGIRAKNALLRRMRGGRRAITAPFAQKNFNNRVQSSDNVTTAPVFKVGKPKKLTFAEKVARLTNPPVIHKRQYAFSSEVSSGRKGCFGIPINKLSGTASGTTGDLYDDIWNNWQRLTTDQNGVDPTFNNAGQMNGAYYVDYISEKLQMVNSGSNSLTGKVSLYAYKRDTDAAFTNVNVPMTPINLMMLGSTNNITLYGPQQEANTNSGWKFDTTTNGANYLANYDMPGSVINTGGATAQVDPELNVLSSHIKHFTGFYFKLINQFSFSLKPGQQINQYTIFNDLPTIQRASQDMTYLRGVSFYLVVEFQAGIVGDATLTTGDNVISTGSGQLSCIVEEKRIIGHKGRKGLKVVMPTAPLASIAKASQYTINPDTGIADTGYDEDQ